MHECVNVLVWQVEELPEPTEEGEDDLAAEVGHVSKHNVLICRYAKLFRFIFTQLFNLQAWMCGL